MIMPGQIAPDFEQDTANGSIRLYQWLGRSWGLLFSHQRDLASLYAAELVAIAALRPELEQRDVKPIGLTRCLAQSHQCWQSRFARTHGYDVGFPLVADADGSVCDLYGLPVQEDPDSGPYSLLVVDDRKRVRLVVSHADRADRAFADILLLIDRMRRGTDRRQPEPRRTQP
jgi:alkyl hydroperoxide reductase subunit AhpC